MIRTWNKADTALLTSFLLFLSVLSTIPRTASAFPADALDGGAAHGQ